MKKKILIIQLRHETNSFCPKMADMESYRNMTFYEGDDVFDKQRGHRNETGGFLEVLN